MQVKLEFEQYTSPQEKQEHPPMNLISKHSMHIYGYLCMHVSDFSLAISISDKHCQEYGYGYCMQHNIVHIKRYKYTLNQ